MGRHNPKDQTLYNHQFNEYKAENGQCEFIRSVVFTEEFLDGLYVFPSIESYCGLIADPQRRFFTRPALINENYNIIKLLQIKLPDVLSIKPNFPPQLSVQYISFCKPDFICILTKASFLFTEAEIYDSQPEQIYDRMHVLIYSAEGYQISVPTLVNIPSININNAILHVGI